MPWMASLGSAIGPAGSAASAAGGTAAAGSAASAASALTGSTAGLSSALGSGLMASRAGIGGSSAMPNLSPQALGQSYQSMQSPMQLDLSRPTGRPFSASDMFSQPQDVAVSDSALPVVRNEPMPGPQPGPDVSPEALGTSHGGSSNYLSRSPQNQPAAAQLTDAQSFWSKAGNYLSSEEGMKMAATLMGGGGRGGGTQVASSEQYGPIGYSAIPVDLKLGPGLSGLSQLAASFGEA